MTGAKLTSARQRAKISLRALAARAGISLSYLADLEKGRRTGAKAQAQLDRVAVVLREMIAVKKAKARP